MVFLGAAPVAVAVAFIIPLGLADVTRFGWALRVVAAIVVPAGCAPEAVDEKRGPSSE